MSAPHVTINGSSVPLGGGPPQQTLQELIRSDAGLKGTAGSCGHGVCGACTILLDGRPARSCLTLSAAAEGRDVVTVEALESIEPQVASGLREAFLESNAFQCGYCTAGWLVLAFWWVTATVEDRRACPDVMTLLEANLCRCTGYDGLRRAIGAVDQERRNRGVERDVGIT